jgi:nucleoside-diphosphate-sugar epimerase
MVFVVTGGGGLVGGTLADALASRGRVLVVDDYSSSAPWLFPGHEVIEGSILDPETLARLPDRPEAVFHVAAFIGNENSMRDPERDLSVNALGTLRVLEYARRSRARVVVITAAGCSMASRTGGAPVPIREDGPAYLDLDTPYQISKLAAELYGRYYARMQGVPVVTARLQNVYGPGECPGTGPMPENPWKNVVPKFIWLALHGRPLPLTGTGDQTRDFVFSRDAAAGLIACADPALSGEAFNLASGRETRLRDLADTINELTGNAAGVERLPARRWDRSGRRVASLEKSRARLGFEARTPMREGLAQTVAWFRDHLERIEEQMGAPACKP